MHQHKNRYQQIFVLFLFLNLLFLLPSFAKADNNIAELDIVSINDFHGMIKESKSNPGLAKLAGMIEFLRTKNPQGFIFVAAGDLYQGSMESNLVYGQSVVSVLNHLKLDATAIGNHEFDWSLATLKEIEQKSNFPYLSCNIFYKQTGKFAKDIAQEYAIIERNGIKIGLIGTTTIDTGITSNPKNVADFIFTDPAKRVNELALELREKGVDVIILLSHMAVEPTNTANHSLTGDGVTLIEALKNVDFAVTGHSHTVINTEINQIPTMQAECYGRHVALIHFKFDKKTKKIIEKDSKLFNASDIKEMPPDPSTEAILKQELKNISKRSEEIIGKSLSPLFCLPKEEQQDISPLGAFIADNMRLITKSDIALQNAGGIRNCNYAPGNITYGMLYGILPFDNTIVTMFLTGKQIIEALNYGICNEKYGTVQFSGLKIEYNQKTKKIFSVKTLDGKTLEPDKEYKVATNDFMAIGGDGWTVFSQGTKRLDTGLVLREVIKDTIKKAGTITLKTDNRLIFSSNLNSVNQAA